VLGLTDSNSTEFAPDTKTPSIIFMPEGSRTHLGGTMRLGSRQTSLQTNDCHAYRLYGQRDIHERHRHRWEVNPDYLDDMQFAGLRFVGKDTTGTRMEIIELSTATHPYFLACQYHPEFRSRPQRPSPPFMGLLKASVKNRDAKAAKSVGKKTPVSRMQSP